MMTTTEHKADTALVDRLVTANRILAAQKVVDGFGHVSVRHDSEPDRFLIARSMAPALVNREDILVVDLDGNVEDSAGRKTYLERFIHSAIYHISCGEGEEC